MITLKKQTPDQIVFCLNKFSLVFVPLVVGSFFSMPALIASGASIKSGIFCGDALVFLFSSIGFFWGSATVEIDRPERLIRLRRSVILKKTVNLQFGFDQILGVSLSVPSDKVKTFGVQVIFNENGKYAISLIAQAKQKTLAERDLKLVANMTGARIFDLPELEAMWLENLAAQKRQRGVLLQPQ